jgi:hypothetical protein
MLPMAALLCALFFFFDVPNAVKISLGLWRLPIEFATKGLDYQKILLVYGVFIALNAMLISHLFNRVNLVDFNIYIPGLLYGIFSFASLNLIDTSFLIGDFFIILSLYFITTIKNNEDARRQIFNAAFFIAIAASININYSYMLLYPFLVLFRIRPFVWREHALILLAYFGVFLYLAAFYFYYQIPLKSIEFFHVDSLYQYESWLVLLVIIATMGMAFLSRQRNLANPGVRAGKMISLWFGGFLLMLFSDLSSYFFANQIGFHNAIFPALYLTYIYSHSKTKFFFRFMTYVVLAIGVVRFFNLF